MPCSFARFEFIEGTECRSRVGWDKSLVLLPYGDEWRQQRKLIVQDLAPSSCPQYYSLQERETRLLVRNILKEPSSLVPELRL